MVNMPSFMSMPVANASGGAGKGRKRDVFVQIKDYYFPNDKDKHGVLEVEEVSTKRRMFVEISKYADQRYTERALWEGNHIDARMQENYPSGSYVALEGLIDYGPDSGKDIDNLLPVNRVIGAPQNPAKVVEGVITLRGTKDELFDVQVWNGKAMSVDSMNELRETFDQAVEYYKKNKAHYEETGKYVLPVKGKPGVQFRAVLDGVVVEMSPAVQNHYLDQNAEDKRLPLSFDEVKMAADYFKQYIASRYPGASVEATTFLSYPASKELVPGEKGPMSTMVLTKGKLAPDADFPLFGGVTLATEGVLMFQPGMLNPRTGKRIGEEHERVNKLLLSGRKFHVQESILTVEGVKPTLSESLSMQYPRTAPGQEQQAEATTEAWEEGEVNDRDAQERKVEAAAQSAPEDDGGFYLDVADALRELAVAAESKSSRGMSM